MQQSIGMILILFMGGVLFITGAAMAYDMASVAGGGRPVICESIAGAMHVNQSMCGAAHPKIKK